MDKYLPASFLEALGGGLAVVAVIAGLGSLFPYLRVHNLRLMAILIIASIALFSNSVSTYFVAMFVIATAVTEIEFLQTLAAIISGNKDYFDLQKEALSTEKKLSTIAKEVKQSETVTESSPVTTAAGNGNVSSAPESSVAPSSEDKTASQIIPPTEEMRDSVTPLDPRKPELAKNADEGEDAAPLLSSPQARERPIAKDGSYSIELGGEYVRRIYELETKAFDKLEKVYFRAIERGVRLRRGTGQTIELDGLIVNAESESDIAFEVKYLRGNRNFISWTKMVAEQLDKIKLRYKEITRKDVQVHFVLILETGLKLTMRQRTELQLMGVANCSVFTAEFLEERMENSPWTSTTLV